MKPAPNATAASKAAAARQKPAAPGARGGPRPAGPTRVAQIRHSRYMWRFDYGGLAADFVNTRTKRLKTAQVESLGSFEDLVDWADAKGVLERSACRALRGRAKRDPAPGRRTLSAVLAVRESLARILLHRSAGIAPARADLRAVNGFLARHASTPEVAASASGTLQVVARPATKPAEALMGCLARHIVELARADAAGRVRRCALPECGSIFIDRTKPNRKLWCHPSICGTLSKVRAFRLRQRAQDQLGHSRSDHEAARRTRRGRRP